MTTTRNIAIQITIFLMIAFIGEMQSNLYTLVLHSQERGAACLDGTPTGLYYHKGSGANKNKFMIYFNSGGFCEGTTIAETLESCYQRTNGNLGSTEKQPPTRNFDSQGLLSALPQVNPIFYDWTKIYIVYCDGSQYTGSRVDPIAYKDKQLYFRGYNNTLQQFYYLDSQFDFYNAQSIVITGVSAGGIATYLYSNYLVQHTKKANIYAMPDSGLFITQYFSPLAGVQAIRLMAQPLFKLVQDQGNGFPIRQCISEYKNEFFHCYNAANLAKYLKAPLFIIESPYDQYSIDNVVVAQCKTNRNPPFSIQNCNETQRAAIQDYRNLTLEAIFRIKGNRKDVGAWAPSCVQHGFTDMGSFTDPRFQIPSVNGPMVYEAMREFLDNPSEAKMYIDQVPWPYNTACSGLTSKNNNLASE